MSSGGRPPPGDAPPKRDRKSTRLNSSHANISYAVFCLKKKNNNLLLPSPCYWPFIAFSYTSSLLLRFFLFTPHHLTLPTPLAPLRYTSIIFPQSSSLL